SRVIFLRTACFWLCRMLSRMQLGIARANLFFASVLGDAQPVQIVLLFGGDDVVPQVKRVFQGRQLHALAAGEDLMPPVLLVPLGEGGGHVHLFDDIAPAHARVVGAEGNLAFLGGVGNDALLGAAEIVVE